MFPQVAGKFFAQRPQGPRNVGRAPAAAKQAGNGAAPEPIRKPVAYEVRIGDRSHKVTVTPA
jgi:methylmalonyl-CoA carboxyltransferase 5S subunit